MARNLYPPTVDSYQAAFDAITGKCKIYFSFSKFSTSASGVASIQLSITNQATGASVVNKSLNLNGVYASTGVLIINSSSSYYYKSVEDEDNLYYIEIPNEWINGGWEPGKIYKAQIRLSEIEFDPKEGQAAWLAEYTQRFSEWSTYTVLKAIGISAINLSNPKWTSVKGSDSNTTSTTQYSSSTLELQGEYFNYKEADNTNLTTDETLYCYEISLYDEEDEELLDSSGKLYQNKTVQPNKLYYLCPFELTKGENYNIHIDFMTINKYEDSFTIPINANWVVMDECPVEIIAAGHSAMKKYATVEDDNEEGRVSLKLYTTESNVESNNFIIRRADSTDNFKKWQDIKIINYIAGDSGIDGLDVFYDYTIESGVYYKYGVQTYKNNARGIFNLNNTITVRRDFEYSYLLGDNCQQLKLKFDNTMENFTPNVSDTKTDTIGGKYPFITRNGNMDYRSFPVNGLISFHMDDQHTFIQRRQLFIDDDIEDNTVPGLYNEDAENVFPGYLDPDTDEITSTEYKRWDSHGNDVTIATKQASPTGEVSSSWIYDYEGNYYDTVYEKLFRDEVIDFLKSDRPRLFKSPTEGNIVVRLTDVKLTPNQSLGRLIYSFTSTAYEIMEPTLENYKSLGISDEGDILEKFVTTKYYLGQYVLENYDIAKEGEPDLINLIYKKYDRSDYKTVSSTYALTNIYNVSLQFDSPPTLMTNNSGEQALGYNISINNNPISIYAYQPRTYVIDDTISFTPTDKLIIKKNSIKDANGNDVTAASNNTITVIVNFLYEMEISDYVDHITKSRSQTSGIGQISGSFKAGTSLYKEVYNKYFLNWPAISGVRDDNEMRYLSGLTWACLEAAPNAMFKIQDADDVNGGEQHRMNMTGILNLEDLTDNFYNIVYLGMWDDYTESIREIPCDILLDYYYELITEIF